MSASIDLQRPPSPKAEPKSSEDKIDTTALNLILQCCPNGYEVVSSGQHLSRDLQLLADTTLVVDMGVEQVGGHKLTDGVKGMVLMDPNYILKPMQSRGRGMFETSFYEEIQHQKQLDNGVNLHGLDLFLSPYSGVVSLTERENKIGGDYIAFTNITAVYKYPSVMDLKLGRKTYVESSSEAKKQKEIKKYPWQEECGYRFVGSRVYNTETQEFVSVDKSIYYSTGPEKFVDVFQGYFKSGIPNKQIRIRTLETLMMKLTSLIQCFQSQNQFLFTSASLLIAYDSSIDEGADVCPLDLKFIDVTHVSPGNGNIDHSTLYGLQRVFETLTQCLEAENIP